MQYTHPKEITLPSAKDWEACVANHRALACISDGDHKETIRQWLLSSTDGLWTLLAKKERNAHQDINRHWKNKFDALDACLQSLPSDVLYSLKQEYQKLLNTNPEKFNSLVAAFGDIIVKDRIFNAKSFTLEHMSTRHLAYMIMGGAIKRSLDLFNKLAGTNIVVFDPENTITRNPPAGTGTAPQSARP